jgi:hypothetical protein
MIPATTFRRIVKRTHLVYDRREIIPILESLSNSLIPPGAIKEMWEGTGIPTSTLFDWQRSRMDPSTPDWIPLAQGHPQKWALPPTVEDAVVDAIRRMYIQTERGATRKTVATLAVNAMHPFRSSKCASNALLALLDSSTLFSTGTILSCESHTRSAAPRLTPITSAIFREPWKIPERCIVPNRFSTLMRPAESAMRPQ